MLARNPPPLRASDLAALRAARVDPAADPDPLRFCRPHGFVGQNGGVALNLEILFTPGRITITNEGGLIRRIYTDGRPLPHNPDPTLTGTSIGYWDRDTLVVETVGIEPGARFPQGAPGALPIGRNVRIIERIALRDAGTLVFDVTLEAPELFTAPYRLTIPFVRSAQTAAREFSACVEHDRAIDPATGVQRFDTTPPADLPPPPRD